MTTTAYVDGQMMIAVAIVVVGQLYPTISSPLIISINDEDNEKKTVG